MITAQKLVILLWALMVMCNASSGDRAYEFQICRQTCIDTHCSGSDPDENIPWSRRLLLWDCPQECDYYCQQDITLVRVEKNEPVLQYHGKWPFVRLGGIQEPAAVLFSLFNFVPNYIGYKAIRRGRLFKDDSSRGIYLRKYYLLFALAQMNAWIWSSVFHTRDFVITERLDYFGAMLTILYGLFTASVRLFRLDRPDKSAVKLAVATACIIFYAGHVGYLSLIHFSYSYNMAAGVAVGLIQNFMWIASSISQYRAIGESWTLWPIWITSSVTAAMSLELFDFAPIWYIFDAHSLWHAATVIPCFWWYAWMEQDMRFLKRSSLKEKN